MSSSRPIFKYFLRHTLFRCLVFQRANDRVAITLVLHLLSQLLHCSLSLCFVYGLETLPTTYTIGSLVLLKWGHSVWYSYFLWPCFCSASYSPTPQCIHASLDQHLIHQSRSRELCTQINIQEECFIKTGFRVFSLCSDFFFFVASLSSNF